MTVLAVFPVVLLLERQQRPQGELRDDRSCGMLSPDAGERRRLQSSAQS